MFIMKNIANNKSSVFSILLSVIKPNNTNAESLKLKANKIVYAGFWRRLTALILDLALVFAITTPILLLIYGHDYFYWLLQTKFMSYYGIFEFILTKLLVAITIILFWRNLGATPGKRLLGCRVVDAKTLSVISWPQALLRLAAYFVSALPLYLGFIWIAWDKQKQGLHDKISQTLVLHIEEDYADVPLQQLINDLK